MFALQNIPLQKKLLRIIFIATGLALLMTIVAFLIYDFNTYRSRIKQNLTSLSHLYNKTLPATLIFNDRKAASENLSTIEAQTEIKIICVYKPDDSIFSVYKRAGVTAECPAKFEKTEKQEFRGNELFAYQPIIFSNEVIGYLFIHYELPPLLNRIIGYSTIAVAVLLSLFLTSMVLVVGLKKYISNPIIKLAKMASQISNDKQYSLRATKHGEDEIGSLTDAFNQMLNTIEGSFASLRESESRFRRLSESNMLGIFFSSIKGTITEANEYFLKMTGYSREDLTHLKIKWTNLTPQEFQYLDERALNEIRSLRMCYPYEKEYVRKDGTRISVLLGEALLEGSQTDLVSFALDITQSKLAEREIEKLLVSEKKARTDAEAALQLREDFMSIAAHELRTPLTPLKLQLEFIKKNLEKQVEANPGIEVLLRLMGSTDQQINRLTRLIEDMLDVSRIRTGRLTLNIEKVDLGELVRNVVKRYQLELDKLNIKLHLNITDHVVGHWDQLRLEQVLINLITNAIKYGQGKPIHVTTKKCQTGACLIVQDEGIGIEKKDQVRIFNRFERAVPKEHFGGFGLGLYITRQIVEAHSGNISLVSQLGKGSIFTVVLPLNEYHKGIMYENRTDSYN